MQTSYFGRSNAHGPAVPEVIYVAGQGEAGPNGTPAGDLFVAVKVKPDKVFTREGDDLHVTGPSGHQ